MSKFRRRKCSPGHFFTLHKCVSGIGTEKTKFAILSLLCGKFLCVFPTALKAGCPLPIDDQLQNKLHQVVQSTPHRASPYHRGQFVDERWLPLNCFPTRTDVRYSTLGNLTGLSRFFNVHGFQRLFFQRFFKIPTSIVEMFLRISMLFRRRNCPLG